MLKSVLPYLASNKAASEILVLSILNGCEKVLLVLKGAKSID